MKQSILKTSVAISTSLTICMSSSLIPFSTQIHNLTVQAKTSQNKDMNKKTTSKVTKKKSTKKTTPKETKKDSSKSTIINTLQFSNEVTLKTLFYPYRDTKSNLLTKDIQDPTQSKAQTLQGITSDDNDNYYVTYATGDTTRYGYIYKYDKKGVLIKKSKKLTMGHGQAITYKNGYLYQIADIRGEDNYTLQKMNANSLTVIKKWVIPSTIHPNVIAMIDDNTAVGVSKSADGYDINKIHLGEDEEAFRDWREKVHISGLIGNTPGKEVQGFAFGNEKYYLLSNGEYMTFNPDGTNIEHISLNTDREPEGIAITKDGKILMGFAQVNEIFIQN